MATKAKRSTTSSTRTLNETTASSPPSSSTEATASPPHDSGVAAPRWLAILLIIGGAAGLAAALALSIELLHKLEDPNGTLSCDINPFLSCSGAMESAYGRAFGFPNSFAGIALFVAPIAVGFGTLAGAKFARWFWTALSIGTVGGLIFALWLAYNSMLVLGLICPWCFLVWCAMYAMTFPLLGWGFASGALPAGPGLRRFAQRWSSWSWVLSLALLVIVLITFVTANASTIRIFL